MAVPGCRKGAQGITPLLPQRCPCRVSCQGCATRASCQGDATAEHPAKATLTPQKGQTLPSVDLPQQMPGEPCCPFPQGTPHAMPLSFFCHQRGSKPTINPMELVPPPNIPKPHAAREWPWHRTPEAESCPARSHRHPLGSGCRGGKSSRGCPRVRAWPCLCRQRVLSTSQG